MVVLALSAGVSSAFAQDSNYWSSAFGTRSQLLGGVVIGSPGDISAVYYNPGAFALAGAAEVLLAGSAYQYQKVSIENGAGPGRSLSSSTLDAVPSLFAGEIKVLKHDRLAYAFLTRRSMDMEIVRRATSGFESMVPITSPQFAAGEINIKQSFTEGWYGLTWAHPLSSRIGVGVSPYVVVRSQHTRASLLTEGRNSADQLAVLSASRDFDYLHWGLLARFGLSGVSDSLTWGLTLTTPNLGITGSGSISYNTTLVDQTGNFGNVMGADYEIGLTSHYKTPLGAGGGASYAWAASRIHAAIDWNAAVDRYTVIEGQPFTVRVPSGDSTVHVVITDRLKSVLNWGVGLEHHFSPVLAGYLSYHTDLSGRYEGDAPGASVTRWNLHHVSGGATLHVWRSDLAFGINAAFASQTTPVPPSPPGAPSAPELQTHEMLLTGLLGWKVSF
jgi:hypothetical protein